MCRHSAFTPLRDGGRGHGETRTVELAEAQLRRVGVEVMPQYAPPLILGGQILPSGDFDLALYGFGVGPSTRGPFDIFGCGGSDNVMGYCDRLMTRDLVQVDRIVDDRRRVGRPEQDRREAREGSAQSSRSFSTPASSPSGRPFEELFRTAWVPGPGTRGTGGSTASGRGDTSSSRPPLARAPRSAASPPSRDRRRARPR